MIVKGISQTKEKRYYPGAACIPEVFVDFVLEQMLDGGYERIIVDIVDSSGKIIPTLILKEESEQDAEYVLRLEILDGRGYSQKIYLDSRKQVMKMILHHQRQYIFERASMEEVVGEFDQWKEYILKRVGVLENEQ